MSAALIVSEPVRMPHPLSGTMRVIRDPKHTVLLVFPADGASPVKFIPAPPETPKPRKR